MGFRPVLGFCLCEYVPYCGFEYAVAVPVVVFGSVPVVGFGHGGGVDGDDHSRLPGTVRVVGCVVGCGVDSELGELFVTDLSGHLFVGCRNWVGRQLLPVCGVGCLYVRGCWVSLRCLLMRGRLGESPHTSGHTCYDECYEP